MDRRDDALPGRARRECSGTMDPRDRGVERNASDSAGGCADGILSSGVDDALMPLGAELIGRLAESAKLPKAERIVALGEATSRGVDNERAMIVRGRPEVEGFVEEELARGG